MMDLIFEYLIVFILLFVTNITFLVIKYDFNKVKLTIFTSIYSMIILILSFVGSSLNIPDKMVELIPYFLGLISLLVLINTIRFINMGKKGIEDDKLVLIGTILTSFLSVLILSLGLKTDNLIISSVSLSVLSIIVLFLVYKISKIFNNAKRPYYAVIGEYMFLEFILLVIFSLTFSSVRELDYSMFGSFLILTPSYQVMYMLILIGIIITLGVLNNDRVLKNLKRK